MATLGCSEDYRVQILERCRNTAEPGSAVPVADLTDFSALEWHRLLNRVSTAGISLPAGCCDQVENVATWRHELTIFRDEATVWQGPITTITPCRNGVTIGAWDMMGWQARRVIHDRHCYRRQCGGSEAPPTGIAKALIVDGFRGPLEFLDDPCGVEWTEVVGPSQRTIARQYGPASAYVLDAVNDLAECCIDYSTIGRRILLMPKGHSLSRTDLLTCDDFADDVCTGEDGTVAATRAYLQGDGVTGAAGGLHPYYGLLEALVEDDAVKTRRAAVNGARDIVGAARPPIRFLDMPTGSTLTSDAPVTVEQLVPGVTVPVILDCVCGNVAEETRLVQLDVTLTRNEGEKIAVGLISPRAVEADIEGVE